MDSRKNLDSKDLCDKSQHRGLFLEPQPWEESFLLAPQGQPDQDSLHGKEMALWRS